MSTKHKPTPLHAPRAARAVAAAIAVTTETAAAPVARAWSATQPCELLRTAAQTIAERGRMRDTHAGHDAPAERSMAATVAAFNALEGTRLSEAQGWRFMQVLNVARAAACERNGAHNAGDYANGAAYAALANEAAEHAAQAARLSGATIDPAALQ